MLLLLVVTPILVLGLPLVLCVPILVKFLRRRPLEDWSPEWVESFSVETYRPMGGLLSNEDFHFLSRQPGFDLSLYKKLRRERLHIFKQYLNRSISDFNQLSHIVKCLLPYASEDCSDVLEKLIRLRFRFGCSVLKAELSYRACLIGFSFISVHSLLQQLEELHSELTRVSALAAAS